MIMNKEKLFIVIAAYFIILSKGDCPFPQATSSSFPIGQKNFYFVGEIIRWRCRFGYQSRGNVYATCQENNSFSQSRFNCTRLSCADPTGMIQFGRIDGVSFDYGKRIYFRCNEDYQLQTPSNIRQDISLCTSRRGKAQWIPRISVFSCKKQICNEARDAPQNGSKSVNPKRLYEFEDEIVFSCDTGYILVGENSTVCLSDGSWSNPTPICQIKSCGGPQQLLAVPNSNLVFDGELNFTYGDIITVECNRFYERKSGFWEWRCSEDAIWTPTDPAGAEFDIPVCSAICGRKNMEENFILGGRVILGVSYSEPYEWPWMVFLNFGARANLAQRIGTCSGFLISPDYVLTAAHCVSSADRTNSVNGTLNPSFVHAWFSTYNRFLDFLGRNTTARYVAVDEIKRHANYNVLPYDSDIALLRLAETIVMNERVRPICLPNTTAEFDEFILGNTTGEVAGWGITENGISFLLNDVQLPTATNERCWNVLQRVAETLNITIQANFMLTDNMFCAGYTGGGLDSTCSGDGGAPYAVQRRSTSKYYAYGIVSFGISQETCDPSSSYRIFVNLNRDLVTWIHENMY